MSINSSLQLQHYSLSHFRDNLCSHTISNCWTQRINFSWRLQLLQSHLKAISRLLCPFNGWELSEPMAGMLLLSPTAARQCVYKALDANGHDVTPLEISYVPFPSLGAGELILLKRDFQNGALTQKVLQKLSAVSLPLIFLSILAIFSPSPSPLPSMRCCWSDSPLVRQSQNDLPLGSSA